MDTTIKHLDKEKKDFTAVNTRLQEEVESLKVGGLLSYIFDNHLSNVY